MIGNRSLVIYSLIVLSFFACESGVDHVSITSPNQVNEVLLSLENGQLTYQVIHGEKKVIASSRLGLNLKNGESLYDDLKLVGTKFSEVDDTWTLPWGEVKNVRNNYKEAVVSFDGTKNGKIQLEIIVRAYDDGIAFRYHVKEYDELKNVVISDELTEFNLLEDAQSWWINAYKPSRYEYLYESTPISEIDTVHTPFTMRLQDGTHLSIHEASLIDYSSMQIAGRKTNELHCDLAPWSNGDKVRTEIPFKTPWRTIKVADSAAELVSSYLTLNCNEPNELDDFSWIKPSKYIGIWWGMIVGKWTWREGFRHGATTERAKHYIDFAAKHGFEEVLVEGWSAGFESLFPGDTVTTSFTESTPDFDFEGVQRYAQSQGVSMQVYQETSARTQNYLVQIDDAFAMLNRLGIDKAKIGHVGTMLDKDEFHYGQHAVNYYRKVLKKAAEYKIAVNFHEPIKSTGERRTYPNMLTREGARGMEYNAWGNGGNPVNHTTILPFTRLLEAPMDFTPGNFDLLYEKLDSGDETEYPVKISLIDEGNGYSNVMYKGGESYWQSKPMSREVLVKGSDTTFIWTITENMKPGEWEWGIRVHDVATDNNNTWLLSILKRPNRKLIIKEEGSISGDRTITIPNQGFDPKARFTASQEDLQEIDANVFGKTQRVNTTLAKQLAYYVVIYSPIQMASDFIENYEDQPAFQFIKDVPVDWDTTIVLNGEIGEFITIARKDRNSQDWYLGSITNEASRSLDIDLSFLGEQENYIAEFYADGSDADWENNPHSITIGSKKLKDNYSFNIAKGGGHAVRFKFIK